MTRADWTLCISSYAILLVDPPAYPTMHEVVINGAVKDWCDGSPIALQRSHELAKKRIWSVFHSTEIHRRFKLPWGMACFNKWESGVVLAALDALYWLMATEIEDIKLINIPTRMPCTKFTPSRMVSSNGLLQSYTALLKALRFKQ